MGLIINLLLQVCSLFMFKYPYAVDWNIRYNHSCNLHKNIILCTSSKWMKLLMAAPITMFQGICSILRLLLSVEGVLGSRCGLPDRKSWQRVYI